jgi:GWxTD domain-containing protein
MLDFWAKRDPDPMTELNEYKEEFFRRVEFANDRFKEGIPGWKTDRGRMYIYLGPPDKIDERFITQNDPFLSASDRASRGPIVFWIYYRYNFGVKFVDRNGTGSYRFDPYNGTSGNIFDAMERAKLGLGASLPEHLEKRFVDFKIDFERENQEIVVKIPVKSLIFRGEGDKVETDFEFKFYVYSKNSSQKKIVTDKRHFESDEEGIVREKYITFKFPFDLKPGKYYFDTIISSPDVGKTRKIVEVKISAAG